MRYDLALPKDVAVLTGDLVNSTGLGPEKVERAFVALENCAEMQVEWMGGQSLHFTRHRGDGWQVALAESTYALRSALCFRAALRALGGEFDSYIGIAEGSFHGEIAKNLNAETSDVFVMSGKRLDVVKSSKRQHIDHENYSPIAILADAISSSWTRHQAKAICASLNPNLADRPNQTELGKLLGKSRQSSSKALAAGRFWHIDLALSALEKNHANRTH
ncbi:hypothetical protein [Celeribacter sp.]|uniref:hypothetical protein n=1 Tax=Celeribacter sp. TaxID=1890673 RepID=UPI003A8CD847